MIHNIDIERQMTTEEIFLRDFKMRRGKLIKKTEKAFLIKFRYNKKSAWIPRVWCFIIEGQTDGLYTMDYIYIARWITLKYY